MQDRPAAADAPGGQIADIETLRAVSILLVLFAHLPAAIHSDSYAALTRDWIQTWSGVDLFFAISGFVITRSLAPRLDARDGASPLPVLVGFWLRRVWRLLPAAWLWLAIAVLCAAAFNRSGAFGSLRGNVADALASVLWVQNFHYAACARHLSPCEGVLAPYWSLSLEEQFYLIYPAILALLPRRWLVPLLLAVIAVQFPLARGGDAETALARWVRCDALAWGVLVARFAATAPYAALRPDFLRHRLARAGAWVLALAALSADPLLRGLGFHVGIIAAVSGALVWAASYDRDLLGAGGAPMRWLGSRSYAIYLCHLVCARAVWAAGAMAGTDDATLERRAAFLLCDALLIAVCAEATFRCVERPLRDRGRRIAARVEARLAGRLAATPRAVASPSRR